MPPKYVLPALAVVFLVLSSIRMARDGGKIGPATRAWLLIAVIFGAVSVYLWFFQTNTV